MNTQELLSHRLSNALAAIESLRAQMRAVAAVADVVVDRLRAGGTLYTCGNGGSAAQASHLAEELIGRYRASRRPLPAICLNSDPAALTCIANDFGFDQVFARQCEALLKPQDALVVLSTSGNSANIINALKTACEKKAVTIGLLGKDGGECAKLCDHSLIIKSHDSAHIQEAHQVVIHLICEAAEQAFQTAR